MIGASLSYQLARSGARVTCVERSFPGAGASGASFSVDITSRKTPKSFFDLSVLAAREHLVLEHELGTAPWRQPTVMLEWGRTGRERTVIRERVERLLSWGYHVKVIDRTAARGLVPAARFADEDDDRIALYPGQAWYDSVILTQLLLWHAQRLGAEVIVGEAISHVDVAGGRVHGVCTSRGRGFVSGLIINCGGPDADSVARLAGARLPVEKVPGLVALVRAARVDLDAIVMAPRINVRPAGEQLLKLHSYQADSLVQGDTPNEAGACAVLRGHAAALLPGLGPVDLVRTHIGIRPIPPDGLPVIGELDGVSGMYAVVTHSAAHLGPLIGRLVAEELAGTASPLLDDFRPQRFRDVQGHDILTAVQDESFRETRLALANRATYESAAEGLSPASGPSHGDVDLDG